MTSVTSLVPFGYAVVQGRCAVSALKKILNSTCCLLRVRNTKRGEFVVCNGKVLQGSWEGKEGEEAWQLMLKYLEESKEPTHLTFYPPPESLSLSDEFEATLAVEEETGSEYFSGVSSLALGKQVMAIIHRLEAIGLEIDDIDINVVGGRAVLRIISAPKAKRVDESVVKKIALEYLEPLGIKEVEVVIA